MEPYRINHGLTDTNNLPRGRSNTTTQASSANENEFGTLKVGNSTSTLSPVSSNFNFISPTYRATSTHPAAHTVTSAYPNPKVASSTPNISPTANTYDPLTQHAQSSFSQHWSFNSHLPVALPPARSNHSLLPGLEPQLDRSGLYSDQMLQSSSFSRPGTRYLNQSAVVALSPLTPSSVPQLCTTQVILATMEEIVAMGIHMLGQVGGKSSRPRWCGGLTCIQL